MANSVPRSKSTILVIVCLLIKSQSAFQYIIDVVNLGDAGDFGSRPDSRVAHGDESQYRGYGRREEFRTRCITRGGGSWGL